MQSSGNCERPTLRAVIGIKVRSGDSLNPLGAEYSESEQRSLGTIRGVSANDLHITLNCLASVPSESRPELHPARPGNKTWAAIPRSIRPQPRSAGLLKIGFTNEFKTWSSHLPLMQMKDFAYPSLSKFRLLRRPSERVLLGI